MKNDLRLKSKAEFQHLIILFSELDIGGGGEVGFFFFWVVVVVSWFIYPSVNPQIGMVFKIGEPLNERVL